MGWAGLAWTVIGSLQLLVGLDTGHVLGALTGGASIALGAVLIVVVLPRKVVAAESGLMIQRPLWRRTVVSWLDIEDIRSVNDRPGSPLAVFLSDGSTIKTELHPVENRSLPRHWHAVKAERGNSASSTDGDG